MVEEEAEAEGRRPARGLGGGGRGSRPSPSREGCVGVTRPPVPAGWWEVVEEDGRPSLPRRGRVGLEAGEPSEASEGLLLLDPCCGGSSTPLPLPLSWGWYWSGWSMGLGSVTRGGDWRSNYCLLCGCPSW